MKTILVDDEVSALEQLEYLLKPYEGVDVIGKYQNPLKALEEIKRIKPETVFLDIEMPEIDGVTMAEEILSMDAKINIVFATAYDEYAIKAFEVNALDFILKPVSRERLYKTIKKIKAKKEESKAENIFAQKLAIEQYSMKRGIKKIPLWKEDSILLVNPTDIFYCTATEKEVTVVTKPELILRSEKTLGYWEKKLQNQRFFRCHRSYLVNMDKVEEIIPTIQNTYVLKLKGINDEIPISRRCFNNLKELLDI
ncbi:MAG: LytTR family DNA-binding domain-containing protein [Clostridia bacterium]|nr:LytTR family DNA-binding domain-containing protein [Clostridia bacterium]